MTTTSETSGAATCVDRARGLALRMLEGGAACALEAWRLGTRYDLVAHGRTREGALVVAVLPEANCPLATMPAGVGALVRLDLVRHSPEVMIQVVAASAHLLGELVLMSDASVTEQVLSGELPERVADLASLPGARVGVVETERALVHDHSGVTPLDWSALAGRRASGFDDFDAYDVLARLGQEALRRVCHGVRDGQLRGQVTVKPSSAGLCSHVRNKVFCVDVDPAGITLMHVGEVETSTVFATFEDRPCSLLTLITAVADLVKDSESVRNQRI